MNIYTFPSEKNVDEAAAGLFAELLRTRPRAVLGLATGGTPIGIYEALVRKFKEGDISFREATCFNLDEYVGLPADHPQSYRTYMRRHLYDHVDLPAERAFIPDGNATDLEEECARYEACICSYAPIDLQLLGIGHNGHIGFNEPAHELQSNTHIVDLSEETLSANARYFPSINQVPKQAITMGIGTFQQAKHLVLVVKGAGKADITRKALTGPVVTKVPASLLQTHPHLTVLATEETVPWADDSIKQLMSVKSFD